VKTKKNLLLLFILIFPSAFYVYLTAGKEKSFVRLPYFGPKHPMVITKNGKKNKDTIFYSIPGFNFPDQNGNTITSFNLRGRIWVCCFENLGDTKVSPSMTILMNRVESRTDLDTTLRLITFALDSETIQSLAGYAKMVHAGKRQFFLSGNSGNVNDFAINAFYQPVDSSYKNGFIHFFLIDKEGCIRGIYNGMHVKEVDNLIDNISMLEAAYAVKANHDKANKGEDDDAM
jgi:protein SCO1/2